MRLEEKIRAKKAEVGVVGLGYVGLPLAMEFVRSGFRVYGIDIDRDKIREINRGRSFVLDVGDQVLKSAIDSGKFRAYSSYQVVSRLDCVSICVPTPLRTTKDPDISHILDAVKNIGKHLHEDMLIVLESTSYPGTTDEVLLPEFQRDSYQVGKNLFVAFSPERVDPGNSDFRTQNTPKIIGGVTPRCAELARLFYEQAIEKVVSVSSTAAAEMVKLLENTFRAVNIGLVNEIAIICDKLGVSVWEVIEAAATKPFGFMPFSPGPGLGGHCIPIDPHYLSWKLKMLNYNARFIELASEVNTHMPEYCVGKISRALNEKRQCVNGSKILVIGVAYKKDISDVRESPALDIMRLLENEGASVDFSDPYVPEWKADEVTKRSVKLTPKTLQKYHMVVLITDHSVFDYPMIQRWSRLIFDSRNAYKQNFENVVKL